MTVDDSADTEARGIGEFGHGCLGAGIRRDRPGDRMFGGTFDRTGEGEQAVLGPAFRRKDAAYGHLTGRDGAGLVEHDRVDRPGRFEDLRTLDEDPQLGAAARSDHERGRRGQAEGTGAGDDEYRDGGREGLDGWIAEQQPYGESGQSDEDDGGDEPG